MYVHGWRQYHVGPCTRTGQPTLIGQYGMHVHQVQSPRAACRGDIAVPWVQDYPELDWSRPPHGENEQPPAERGSCGYYVYRLFPPKPHHELNVYAHVTALGVVVIHEEGFRTQRYQIDYLMPSGHSAVPDIALRLHVPIYAPDDPRQCAACVKVNKELERWPESVSPSS